MTQEEIRFLLWTKESLQKLSSFITVYDIYKDQITDPCKHIMWELLPRALTVHQQIISRGSAAAREVQPISLPPFRAECGEDLALLSRLFEYVDAVHPSRQSV